MKQPARYHGSEIALIGMACRFPGSPDLDRFRENLRSGTCSISFFAEDELHHVDPRLRNNPDFVRAKGMLEDVECFDAAFFGFSQREAEVMDPQFRLLHECCWSALEHAGYPPGQYNGRIGLYAGAAFNDGWISQAMSRLSGSDGLGPLETSFLVLRDYLTTQISYRLSLRGPSMLIQTACSTSLVAVHQAAQSLLAGECGIALAGGVSLTTPLKSGYLYQEGGILSRDGVCRAFDAGASGTVFGDGVGIVVLKRLEDALHDGDTIHAIIKGSAVNNDGGRKVGYTAPGTQGQIAVLKAAYRASEVDPRTVTLVEAHGTGTLLGDPIEVEALARAFNADSTGFCALGSVKSNLGHLNVAAGVASLIKAALALRYRELLPSVNFREPNPKLNLETTPFFVCDRLASWPEGPEPRRAGVSSFGIGGTNAHVVLEEPPSPTVAATSHAYHLLPLSARTMSSLATVTAELGKLLQDPAGPPLADVAFTLQRGREQFPHRCFAVASCSKEAGAGLMSRDHRPLGAADQSGLRPVFLFPGHGSQHAGMASGLYRGFRGFRDRIDGCLDQIDSEPARRLRRFFEQDAVFPVEALDDAGIVHPLLFLVEHALAQLLIEFGIRPYAMAGYSLGEYTAACLAGVMTAQDALSILLDRGRLFRDLPSGTMMVVALAPDALAPLLPPTVEIAAVNTDDICTLAGPLHALELLGPRLSALGHAWQRVAASNAFHSSQMDPVIAPLLKQFSGIALRPAALPLLSSVTGEWAGAELSTPQYWGRNLRDPVRFSDTIRVLGREPGLTWIEVGPGNMLTSCVRSQLGGGATVVNLMPSPQQRADEEAFLLERLGALWESGAQIDWAVMYRGENRRRVPLPGYAFEKKRIWDEHAAGGVKAPAVKASERRSDPSPSTSQKLADLWGTLVGARDLSQTDNFFELGGHSLTAARLRALIAQHFDADLALSDIFQHPTLGSMSELIDRAKRTRSESIPRIENRPSYATSPAQRYMYELTRRLDTGTAYNFPIVLTLEGPVDAARFEATFRGMIARHESFRTAFAEVDCEIRQIILEQAPFSLPVRHVEEGELSKSIEEFIRPFDLSAAPLLRAELLSVDPGRHLLLLDMHNLVADGISINVFVHDFAALYRGETLPAMAVQYKDYAAWQLARFTGPRCGELETAWLDELASGACALNIAFDFPRPKVRTFHGNNLRFDIGPELRDAMTRLARERRVTMNVLILALYAVLLHQLSAQETLSIGSVTGSRPHPDLEPVIGLFTNVVPVRVSVRPRESFLDFLDRCSRTLLAAYDRRDYPFELLLERLSYASDGAPLIDTTFTYHNEIDSKTRLELEGLRIEPYDFNKGVAKFAFKLDAIPFPECLQCVLQYNTALFTESTVRGWIDSFQKLAERVVKRPEDAINSLLSATRSASLPTAGVEATLVERALMALDCEHPNPFLVHRSVVIEGSFTAGGLAAALERMIPECATLRMRWSAQGGTACLIDVPTTPEQLLLAEDLRNAIPVSTAAIDSALQDVSTAFEASEPLWRFRALRIADERWILSIVAHPVASDSLRLEPLLETLRNALEHVPKAARESQFVSARSSAGPGPVRRIPTAGAVLRDTLEKTSSGHLRDLCQAAGVTLFHGLVALTSDWLTTQAFAEFPGTMAIWRPTETVDQGFGPMIHPHFIDFPSGATLRDRFDAVAELCTASVGDQEQASHLLSLAEHPVAVGITWEISSHPRDGSSIYRFEPWAQAPVLCPFRWNFAFGETSNKEISCRFKFQLSNWDSTQAGDVLRDWKRFVQSARMSSLDSSTRPLGWRNVGVRA
ncbi:condensation domain-containing protein [Bradyrhizobium ontarionense]|uniref:Condensation domain-containing protein n=1 Tax=Bradyrhizobium ontarionense TaxID=2898149 RepID=A0ABY3R9N4_9BRAD|nr:type I polyketide synthase [Bradyrhizobium sp. A19]UFZ04085.1 condensation domain-containing protein [Bradyrhizobium sp. A19]